MAEAFHSAASEHLSFDYVRHPNIVKNIKFEFYCVLQRVSFFFSFNDLRVSLVDGVWILDKVGEGNWTKAHKKYWKIESREFGARCQSFHQSSRTLRSADPINRTSFPTRLQTENRKNLKMLTTTLDRRRKRRLLDYHQRMNRLWREKKANLAIDQENRARKIPLRRRRQNTRKMLSIIKHTTRFSVDMCFD